MELFWEDTDLTEMLDNAFEVSQMRFNSVWSTLFDLYKYRVSLPSFNIDWIDPDIFDCNLERISNNHMIIKKWTAYYVIDTGWNYGWYVDDILAAFPDSSVKARFTEYELFQVYNIDDIQNGFRYELLDLIQSEFTHTYI